MTPFAMRSAVVIAKEITAEALEGGLSKLGQEVAEAGEKALASVADKGEAAIAEVKDMIAGQEKQLKTLGDSLDDLTEEQAGRVLEDFSLSVNKGAGKIETLASETAAKDESELAAKLGKISDETTSNFKNSLEDLDIPKKDLDSITSSMDSATREADTDIAASVKPKEKSEGVAEQPKPDGVTKEDEPVVEENVVKLGEGVDTIATKEGDGAGSSADHVKNGTEPGTNEPSPEKEEKVLGGADYGPEKEPKLESGWQQSKRLTEEIKGASKAKGDLERDIKESGVTVKKPAPGETGSATLEIKAGKFDVEQLKSLQKTFSDDAKSRDVPSDEVKVVTGADGKQKLSVKTGDSTIEYDTDPSDISQSMLGSKDKGSWTQRSDGKMTFKTNDSEVVAEVSGKIDGKLEQIEGLKKDITEFETARKDATNFVQRGYRISKEGISYAYDRVGTILKEEKLDALERVGGALKTGVKKLANGILEIAKMMMTGVFFGVPSMIYQTLMQQAAAKALYEQITAVYHITPDFAVQIPASLISAGNAAQAGTYLYVAVDPSTSGFGNSMSSAFLENASYYVIYQTGAQWGSTYATSQNAFGVWVSLNTGLVFMDGGVPYSDQTPFSYLMEPTNDATIQSTKGAQTTLSVQDYTGAAFDAIGNRANFAYSEGFMDAIAPWNIATESYDHAVTPNSTLQLMFAAIESSVTHGTEKIKKASRYAPKVLVRTLNIFRNGIQNVPGFLPGSKISPPAISIRQFEGTGILNRLLGSQSSSENITQSIQLITTLSSTMSPKSSTPAASTKPVTPTKPTNVVQAVADAQAGLKQALSDANSSNYGNEVAVASAALKDAQTNLESAIKTNGSGTNLGLDSSLDVNAYNIYLYETEDTSIVKFMKNNRFSDLIPAKDYVVFLDSGYNIVPLFSTAVITRPDAVAVIDFDTSQINSNSQYMASLVTGLIYLYSASGPGTVMSSLNNVSASLFVSGTVMPALFGQIALVLSNSDTQNLINQILSMANYATNLSYQGPVFKNGCLFEKIPLEVSSANVAADKQNALDDALNGVVIPKKNVSAYKTLFGSSVQSPQNQLDSMYLYKVSKVVQGSKQQAGVFGTNAMGQPIYDYVVPVAPITNADGTSGFQMMPLGIAEAAPSASGLSGIQMMVSLVTGQVYDNNYALIANFNSSVATATVIERDSDFNPIIAQPGQDSIVVPYTKSDGTVVNVNGAVIKNLPMGTAFMPTFCNPFNITYGSLFSNSDYASDTAAVNAAQKVVQTTLNAIHSDIGKAENPAYVQDIWAYIQSNPTPKVVAGIFASKSWGPKLGLTGEPAGTLQADINAWIAASAALIPLQNALRLKVQALQSVLQPPYAPVTKALDQMVIMCPMYWMHYAKFAWAAQSANAQTITYNTANGQAVATPPSINWISTSVSSTTTPFGCSLAQALPVTNVLDVVNAYDGWQEIMNSSSGIAKVMQSGPFQFSKNEQYNVYLTLPASNGPLNLSTGNFFYSMVPVASPTSLFVLGNLDPGIAKTIMGSLNQGTTSGLTAPLTLDQCNAGDLLGHSYLDLLDEHPVAIDISTGDVWLPTPLGYSALCYNTASGGNIANAQCNVFKIGTLDAEKVLDVALVNQNGGKSTPEALKAQMQIDNPGLYSTLMSCQALAIQKAQLALTTYFAGSLLSLCQEQITNGTYIYAVNVSPENYYEATDYWVATDDHANLQGVLTPQTQYMVSLVTGNVYQMNASGVQQTAQSVQKNFKVGTGVATKETPLTLFQKMFGIGSHALNTTTLTPVASNNPKLFNIIESLNNLQQQDFLQTEFAPSANTNILTGQIPLAALQKATPVSALYSTLYLVNGKYYLAMPGTAGAPTYYYDFNAEEQDVNSSSGTAVYTPIPGDAQRGMYYIVEGTGSTAVATPVSALTGYGCQAMRMRFGIAVDKSGNETMGLPVYNPPLPMTANDAKLAAGASGDNMKCLTSPAKIASNTAVTDTYTYYQYKNIVSDSYLTRCYLNTQLPVYSTVTQAITRVPELQDYYVDLVTGECYSSDGTPRLSEITVAYNFSGDETTGIVGNSALDFSNPLFVWGELDMLGESLQAYMMYQDTKDNDPSYGYNEYQVQQYSTSFTLYKGGNPTVYAYAVDAGNIQITQNGNPMSPAQTSMSSALVTALNNGSSLATKSYTMNINGVVPSGTPVAGATVTVTETFVAPKQYMISYTDANGDLVTDMFQTPVTSGPGTAPGASMDSTVTPSIPKYNNPPLDASLQAQLLQGKPFCARVFASCPYGQETVQNINTTIASATTAAKELALGTTGITCGLLYQPATATSFSLSSAGLLSAIFSGANPSGSTGAMNGQYFAFYDCYNNGSGTPNAVVPNKGQYSTYTSVVSSMTNNYASGAYYLGAYPGLYAGNFNVEFTAVTSAPAAAPTAAPTASDAAAPTASDAPAAAPAPYVPPVVTTYGAPYLRVMPLTGTIGDAAPNPTAYAVPPTSGTEYLYKYQYDIVPNALLAQLKSTLNISGNVAGFMQLVSALDGGDLAGVTVSNASLNEAAAVAISNQVRYGTPLNALTQEPKGRYVYKLACASGGADADPAASTNGLCQMFYTAGAATNPDTYIDMYNGIVFQSQKTSTNLYPIGFSVSHDQRNAISQMVGGAVPAQGSKSLTINTPVVSTAVTKTNPKGNPVGQGAALPGQIVIVKGKATATAIPQVAQSAS